MSCLLELIEQLRDVHIDVIEFCLLNAIVLTFPGLYDLPQWHEVTDSFVTAVQISTESLICYMYTDGQEVQHGCRL